MLINDHIKASFCVIKKNLQESQRKKNIVIEFLFRIINIYSKHVHFNIILFYKSYLVNYDLAFPYCIIIGFPCNIHPFRDSNILTACDIPAKCKTKL